ncbi:unnamed protein product [Phytophthora fragariaefolia]|uniref:Unnamed protein product n=1 Tax=Phytophthora fragariaefolia TaxID=1490495 RepID=A0A9W6XZG7_9STRA|nr:unnamed protein product [Phytophthora fragariaefolia]
MIPAGGAPHGQQPVKSDLPPCSDVREGAWGREFSPGGQRPSAAVVAINALSLAAPALAAGPRSALSLCERPQRVMMSTADRFGAVELTPRHDEPLLVPGSAALDAMAAPCVVSVRVVAAVELRPMHKGITSNPMVEVSLVRDDGSQQFQRSAGWGMGADLKAPPGMQPRSHRNSTSSLPAGGLQQHGASSKPFKSKVIKSSLNPIWNFDVDFGDVDADSVAGVLFTVRHVEKFGMVKKDIGQLVLSLRDIMELKMVRVF